MKQLTDHDLHCLSFYQLELFIRKNESVEQCKREWRRRTARNYPRMPHDKEPDELEIVPEDDGQLAIF